MKLVGVVASGTGTAAGALRDLLPRIAAKFGIPDLLPDTFNLRLGGPFSLSPTFSVFARELGRDEDYHFQPCTVNGIACVIMRTTTNYHGDAVIEIMSAERLRSVLSVTDGDHVVVDVADSASQILSLNDHVGLQAHEAAALLGRSIRPVFLITTKRVPFFWGTGVLLRVGDSHFLASAAHVFHRPDDSLPNGFLAGVTATFGSQRHVELVGRVHRTIPPDLVSSDADEVDVAVMELSDTEAGEIDDARFLTIGEIDVRDHEAPRRGYFHLGYPGTKQELDLPAARFKAVPFPYVGFEVSEAAYEDLGYSRETNLALKFDRQNVWIDGDKRGVAPKPDGTSGGGWWRIDNSFAPISSERFPKLVAITSKYFPGREKALLAVRVSRIVQLLRVARPDLGSLLPDTSFLPELKRWQTVPGAFCDVS